MFEDCQSLDLVAWRGRWAARRTLEVYIQEIGPAALLAEVGADTRHRIDRFAAALPELLKVYGQRGASILSTCGTHARHIGGHEPVTPHPL